VIELLPYTQEELDSIEKQYAEVADGLVEAFQRGVLKGKAKHVVLKGKAKRND
jgi:hypothetical protein